MLNRLIRWSLENRLVVLMAATLVLVGLGRLLFVMPLDVFPELKAPTVTVMTEAPGYAAEEVELAVTFPVETALYGLPGVRRVRSSSALSLSIVWVEFDFETDIFRARQLVAERLAQARETLPADIHPPEMTPIASISGEVMLVALRSTNESVSPLDLRRVAEYDLRRRLLAVQGVAQVIAIGGELPELQVLARPDDLRQLDITLKDVEEAVAEAHAPAPGGYLADVDGQELPIVPQTRATTVEDVASTVVGEWRGAPVTLDRVADVRIGGAPRRGTASAMGGAAVVLSVQRNPGVDTLRLTRDLDEVLDGFESSLPAGYALVRNVFRQADFIHVALENVGEALRDGVIFVVLVLFLFLLNVRTTLITLTALPLSIGIALLVLDVFGASVNVMTLGGIAVAIGSLVDDAIVDVENVFRRLRENAALPVPERRPVLEVVYRASVEVRSSIFLATLLIVLVFVPLFFLTGVEGRFFRPLGAAYVISLGASLLVAMTVTPVLCHLFLGRAKVVERAESRFVVGLKDRYERLLLRVQRARRAVGASAFGLVVLAVALGSTYGTSFLPDFNEGSITLFLNVPVGTSLQESDRVMRRIDRRVAAIDGVAAVTRRTGRAEQDEHAEPVSASEVDVRLEPGADIHVVKQALQDLFREAPGVTAQIGGPISHRLSHILSGTPAAVAIKVFGDDLDELRAIAREIDGALRGLPGVVDLVANREVTADTLQVAFDRARLAQFGLTPGAAARQIETAFRGRTVSALHRDGARLDLVVRLRELDRDEPSDVGAFLLQSGSGARVPVRAVASLYREAASNLITRENVKRKAVVSMNVAEGHNLGDLVAAARERVDPIIARHPGTWVEYGGQFEAQEAASRRILLLSVAVLLVIVALLYTAFGSLGPAFLILINLPLALVGSVVAMFLADSPDVVGNLLALFGHGVYVPPVVSIASIVGFIGLSGIAARNGLLLVSHYQHLLATESIPPDEAVRRAARERLVPILMTALSSALALVPLAFAKDEIGSEIQHPLAVVILGGLVSSTFLNLVVIPAGLRFVRFGDTPHDPLPSPKEDRP